jgi:hypothetical protein
MTLPQNGHISRWLRPPTSRAPLQVHHPPLPFSLLLSLGGEGVEPLAHLVNRFAHILKSPQDSVFIYEIY